MKPSIPDLRAECRGLDAKVAQLRRIIACRVADPAAVAMMHLQLRGMLGAEFDLHIDAWPPKRISEDWEVLRAETEALLTRQIRRAA